MYNRKYNSRNKQKFQKSPEKQILTWLRKRISPYQWATSRKDKSEFKGTRHRDVTNMFATLREGRRGWLAKPTNQVFIDHATGKMAAHFVADGRKATPETLVIVDIDCHERGTAEGALACAEFLRTEHFPNLYFERSSGGKGIHCLLRVDKRDVDDFGLHRAIVRLQTWLRSLHAVEQWDIQAIEVKGTPPLFLWGHERHELLDLNLGQYGQLPTGILTDPMGIMNTSLVTVDWMTRLRPVQGLGFASDAGREHAPDRDDLDEQLFGVVDHQELRAADWVPSMRSGEWPLWVLRVARDGVPEEDRLGAILHEIAKWLVWIELYDAPDTEAQAEQLLQSWLNEKHNDRVSRLGTKEGRDLVGQIRRAVRCAGRINSEGKEIFARIRQKRSSGKYQHVILIAGLMVGAGADEAATSPSIPSTYSIGIRTDPLPDQIEVQIDRIAKANKLRKRAGIYPLVAFARSFLAALWDQQGSARISQAHLDQIADTDQHTKYRQLLRDHGLIEDYQGTYRAGSASTLYRLTSETLDVFVVEAREMCKIA